MPSRSLALLLVACTGEIGDTAPTGTPSDPGPGDIPPGYVPGDVIPVEPALHRLTNDEYDRTVRDLFALDYDASERFDFRPDDLVEGYSTSLASLSVTLQRAKEYRTAAKGIALDLLGTPGERTAIMGCDVESDSECLRSFLSTFGTRVYRRPLATDEVDRLLALGAGGESATDHAILALEAMLQSPHFLHRVEIGEGTGRERVLGDYEVASRISYALFGTTPDPTLLGKAERGELSSGDAIEAAVRDMLADDRARTGIDRFVSSWLRLAEIERGNPDDALLRDATAETRRVLDAHVWNDADLGGIFTTRSTTLTPALAEVYGVTIDGELADFEFGPDEPRAGILTHASFLASTGKDGAVVAVPRRGKMVRESFLCLDVLTLPGDLELPEPDPNATVREFWGPIETASGCGACHGSLNSIGHLFDRYDARGAYRESDSMERPIPDDGAVRASSSEEGVPMRGAVELGAYLATAPEVDRCVAEHLHRYVHGREAVERDRGHIEEAARALDASGGRFLELVVAFLTSEAFTRVTTPEPIGEVELGSIVWEE